MSHRPVVLLAKQGIVVSRSKSSEAAGEQECVHRRSLGRLLGNPEIPLGHLLDAFLLCVSHGITVSQSERTVQVCERFEALSMQYIHNNRRMEL